MSQNGREQLDSEGNPLQVANLTFIEGIIGKGAYGTVRLAKRSLQTRADEEDSLAVMHDSMPAAINFSPSAFSSPNGRKHFASLSGSLPSINFDMNAPDPVSPLGMKSIVQTPTTPPPHARRDSHLTPESAPLPPSFKRSKSERVYNKSLSDPGDSDFFTMSEEEKKIYGKSGLTKFASQHHKSPRRRTRRISKKHAPHDDIELEEHEQLVAVKIFQKSILKRIRTMERSKETRRVQVKTAFEKVEREIALMKKLQHPNLVEFYDAIDSPDSDLLYMVIEYMPLGEILSYQNDGTFRRKTPPNQDPIDGLVDGHFDEFHAALYFVDIMHGLAYLHQHHIIHRDLKPENVLLDARGIAKLSDFGVSHMFDEKENRTPINGDNISITSNGESSASAKRSATMLTRQDTELALKMKKMSKDGIITKTEGTWAFWSPEMCEGAEFSGYAADIWAAGVCLYIFVTGKLPFFSEMPLDLMDMIREAKVPYDGLDLSDNLLELLQMTLEKDPEKRAGVGDCLKHPFLLLARAQRVQTLSVELAKSSSKRVTVEERDLQSAFRIVTTMPVVFLKSATKQLHQGLKAVKRVAVGRSSSFDGFTRKHRDHGFGALLTPVAKSAMSGDCSVVEEASLELFSGGEESSSHAEQDSSDLTSSRNQHGSSSKAFDGHSSGAKLKNMLLKFSSFGSNTSAMENSEASRLSSVFSRRKRDSDVSMSSDHGHKSDTRLAFLGRRRSDVSGSGTANGDDEVESVHFHSSFHAITNFFGRKGSDDDMEHSSSHAPRIFRKIHSRDSSDEDRKHSSITGVVRKRLSALKRHHTDSPTS